MKIAATLWSTNPDDPIAEQGAFAEALGYHSFWLPENHFGERGSLPSPLTVLAAVAARTSRIRLGSTSYLLPIRHPLQAAEEVAVLDQISGGRVILGVGRGTSEAMFRAYDQPTKEKRRTFAANLARMISAWSGEPVAEDGNGEPVQLAPLPVQQPHPPVWIAAFGPLALKQAGTLGCPYLASPIETIDKLAENYETHARHREAAGHEGDIAVPVMRTVYIAESIQEAERVRSALRESAPHAMRASGAVDDWVIVGTEAEVIARVEEYRARLGMTHLIVRGRISGMSREAFEANLRRIAEVYKLGKG